mmetsp:Transcript_3410/g.5627  ORF Transcript_3410/g.5627 Transcript_3410/m.5627 type:complete len:285 (-) Transcript_3410:2030-2884(-)
MDHPPTSFTTSAVVNCLVTIMLAVEVSMCQSHRSDGLDNRHRPTVLDQHHGIWPTINTTPVRAMSWFAVMSMEVPTNSSLSVSRTPVGPSRTVSAATASDQPYFWDAIDLLFLIAINGRLLSRISTMKPPSVSNHLSPMSMDSWRVVPRVVSCFALKIAQSCLKYRVAVSLVRLPLLRSRMSCGHQTVARWPFSANTESSLPTVNSNSSVPSATMSASSPVPGMSVLPAVLPTKCLSTRRSITSSTSFHLGIPVLSVPSTIHYTPCVSSRTNSSVWTARPVLVL